MIGVGVTALLLNGLGNIFQLRALKLAALPVVLVGLTLTAWAITFHHVFNARQIFLRSVRLLAALAILALSILSAQHVLRSLAAPSLDLLLGLAVGGALVLGFERRSAAWFRLEGDPPLSAMRAAVITTARTSSDFSALARRFEALLAQWGHAPAASLLFNESAGHRSSSLLLPRDHPALPALCNLGWATPESLQRRRTAPGFDSLHHFLAQHSLGLALVVPRGSSAPSLIVALGIKSTEAPFTYPEVERLQNVVELMDNILSHSRLSAQAALKTRTEHLAMMSRGLAHDLKNLLTPVSSFLVHTEGRFAPDTPEAEVHAAARHSIRVMSDYVREARFFAEQLAPRLEACRLSVLCASACDVVRPRADTRRLALVAHVPVDHAVTLDGVLLQRLLANLLANAIDASPPGSAVILSAEIRPPHLVFEVEDHGTGIPPENLARIFEPYFTTKEFGDDVRGFGLGLTICQKIAALHHGTIAVASIVGHGTTFTVELPFTQPPVSLPVAASAGAR